MSFSFFFLSGTTLVQPRSACHTRTGQPNNHAATSTTPHTPYPLNANSGARNECDAKGVVFCVPIFATDESQFGRVTTLLLAILQALRFRLFVICNNHGGSICYILLRQTKRSLRPISSEAQRQLALNWHIPREREYGGIPHLHRNTTGS